jgi:uncharacterized RDD family membrane protein YckC
METPKPPDEAGPEQPPGPQAPAPPPPPPGPQAPAGPQSPAPAEAPPGGWQQPIARQQPGWVGRPLAGWGTRLAATLLDWLILLVPVVILVAIIVGVAIGSDTGGIVSTIVGFLIYLVVAFIYAPVLMSRDGGRNGQTWGKQILGIRVVRDSGEPMSFWYAALREIGVKGLAVSIASSIIPLVPWLLNYLWPLWDDQNRALHDMVVSTHVVEG